VTYDFNTGLTLSTTDANGRTAQTSYDADSLRPQTAYLPTGAYTSFAYDDAAMTMTETIYTAGGAALASQNVKRLNGRGQVRREEALGQNGVWDVVDTQYDSMGGVSQQTRPYRNGYETPQWIVITYDALGRTTSVQQPDGSISQAFYNEASRPDVAAPQSSAPGQTTRMVDAWGRERWGRTDAGGRLVEVVEPNPQGDGSIWNGGLATTYSYNTLGNLTAITQGSQTRSFRYDAVGRLTNQKLAEASATLNDAGTYVGAGTWSDVFSYDDRSNLTSHTDARGVKTIYTYSNDPLNRLQQVSYDASGFGDTGNPILPAATISYSYMTTGDVTRTSSVSTAGVSTESFGYDSEGRISTKTLTLASRTSYPMVTDYIYDSLDRLTDVRYPAEYGTGSAPRKVAHYDYDVASRTTGVQVDGASYASELAYNGASQTTSLKVGAAGANQITESYNYNAQTGLLENQTVVRGGSTTLLNLSYDYAGANGKRTGQLVRMTNNLDASRNRDRAYSYDMLGRLTQSKGGPTASPLWTESYSYDRYGNRLSVTATGNHAGGPAPVCATSQNLPTDQFVKNVYQAVLNRQPSATELQSWLDLLRQNYYRGQSQLLQSAQYMIRQLFKSNEYASRNRTDREFVYDLYKSYLQREPDQGGWDYWTSVVPSNGRDNVRRGFDLSTEFSNVIARLCPQSGGASGPVPVDGLSNLSYDAPSNRINTPGFGYDAAGNQTRAQRADGSWQKFQYDAAGRLVKVRDDYNYTLATYTYGSSNQRLIVQDGDEGSNYRTYYAWTGDSVLAEYRESDSSASVPQWSQTYVYLGGRLLASLSPNGAGGEAVQYHHPDRLGTRLITNAADTTVQEQVALPFGVALDGESSGASSRRFTSYERNGVGLDYAVNRHYDPQQGRFTQVDPIGISSSTLSDPQSLNLYAYCGNDPVNRIDPDGLFWGKLFKSLIKRVVNAIIHAVIAAVFTLITTGSIHAAIGVGVATFVKELGFPSKDSLGIGKSTPPFNPNAGSALSRGVSGLNRYIINNFTQNVKYNAQRVEARAQELLALIAKILGSQRDAILKNKQDVQSVELSLCQAAQESGFNQVLLPNGQIQGIEGLTGDLGLFQIQFPSAQDAAKRMNIGSITRDQVRDNDSLNTQLATNHLQNLINQFGGDVRTALGAYKQGRRNVLRHGLTVRSQEYADAILKCEQLLQAKQK
jgi:RHS repeat-associated protein